MSQPLPPASQAASPIIVVQSGGAPILLRFLYFVFIGWWLGGLVSLLAWVMVVTVILLPAGLWIVNRLPTIITLVPPEQGRHRKPISSTFSRGRSRNGSQFVTTTFIVWSPSGGLTRPWA